MEEVEEGDLLQVEDWVEGCLVGAQGVEGLQVGGSIMVVEVEGLVGVAGPRLGLVEAGRAIY